MKIIVAIFKWLFKLLSALTDKEEWRVQQEIYRNRITETERKLNEIAVDIVNAKKAGDSYSANKLDKLREKYLCQLTDYTDKYNHYTRLLS